MKTIRFQLLLLALFVMVGCQKDEMSTSMKKGSYSLVAYIESNDSTSRTAVDENGGVTWVATDAIGVFGAQTKNAKFESISSGSNVLFIGNMDSSNEKPSLAYYPYDKNASLDGNALSFTLPSEYSYTGQSYAPMLGIKQANGDFAFKHLVGLLKVTVKNMPENAKRLFVVSEGTEEKATPAITGNVLINDVTANNATLSVTDNKGHEVSIDLKNTSAQETYTFYIPVPVGEYPKLSVKLEMNDGVIYMDKSVSNVNMVRAMMLDMPVLDAEKEEIGITAIVRGTVDIENPEGLIVKTMVAEQVLNSKDFSVEVLSNGLPQVVYVTDENDNILMMARSNEFGRLEISAETTAMALITIMPSFVYDIQDDYKAVIELIENSSNYSDIVNEVKQIISAKNDIFDTNNAILWTRIGELINNLFEYPMSRSEIEFINKEHLKVTSVGRTVKICNTKLYPPYECEVRNASNELVYNKVILSASSYGLMDLITSDWGNDICGEPAAFSLLEKGEGEFNFNVDRTSVLARQYFCMYLLVDVLNAIFNGVMSFDIDDAINFSDKLFVKSVAYTLNTLPTLLFVDDSSNSLNFGGYFKELGTLVIQDLVDIGWGNLCSEYIKYKDKRIEDLDDWIDSGDSLIEDIPDYKEKWKEQKTKLEKQRKKLNNDIDWAKAWKKIISAYETAKATSNFINRCIYAKRATEVFEFNLCNYLEKDEIVSCTETELYISGGNEQEGYPKQKLELPLKVFVKSNYDDGTATTLTDYQGIKFEVVSGGGYVEESFVSVDEKTGVASTYWTLGEAGEQKVRVVAYGSISKQELSEPVYFTASFAETPTSVATTEATNITQTTATLSGNIQGYEADDFQHRYGIIYSTDANPTASNGTIVYSNNIQEDGNYSVDVASLTENTTYYYRAFVIEGGEYVYGDVLSFTTQKENMSERDILIAFYKANGGDNWKDKRNWCTDKPLGEWGGVRTNEEGFVTNIYQGSNYQGSVTGDVVLSGLTHLEYLVLDYHQITSLDVSGCINLKTIRCVSNKDLTSLNIEGCYNLESVYANDTKLTSLDVSNRTKLKILDVHYNGGQLRELNITGCRSLEDVNLKGSPLFGTLDLNHAINLKVLNCESCRLSELRINECINLETLYCRNNQLTVLDISNAVKMKLLDCRSNMLAEIVFPNSSALESFDCSRNQLSDIKGLLTSTTLRLLSCAKNNLVELIVPNASNITSIDVDNNQLSKIDVQNCASLVHLTCIYNKLKEIDVSSLKDLETLNCTGNQLVSIDLDGCESLEDLHCTYNNELELIDVSSAKNLKSLGVRCENLKYLYLPIGYVVEFNNINKFDYYLWNEEEGEYTEDYNMQGYQYPEFRWK